MDSSLTLGRDTAPVAIKRTDYRPPAYHIPQVDLDISLHPEATAVRATLKVRRVRAGEPLVLQGHGLELKSIRLDGRDLLPGEYALTPEELRLPEVPDEFVLETETQINPSANAALEGLYISRGLYCTQCEAEGFRRITYFLDRPDIMSRFRVRLVGNVSSCPVLLSNGNLVETGSLPDGRHFAVWEDPIPKPCYLFALVAGNLGHIEDTFTTASGRTVALRIYAAPADLDKCDHAMASLKAAMAWDEAVYGLEYDLDIYNIVAISDFNMGAMENKSLNVFNTKCVLAKAETATDADFAAVEGVIAHEYFHNWTGNRVTCRDWFQLSLKEGLTVFRDQQFSADQGSAAVKRIDDVRTLRTHQFPEDAGPLAHPVRPDSYIEINNFYTATVYEKGAEVIRMMHRLLGAESFRKGMDLYFARHDGQAVTCDDFVAAMEDASGVDLSQFRLWYSQAGTPEVTAQYTYDAASRTFTLTLSQVTPSTPGQPEKKPLHIPVSVGLLGQNGAPLSFTLRSNDAVTLDADGTAVLNLREASQTFVLENVAEPAVPSLLRGFSAPVRLKAPYELADLRFLMQHDRDSFNRWEASQKLATALILNLADAHRAGSPLQLDVADVAAYGAVLNDTGADPALIAEALTLPSENDLALERTPIDVEALHVAREYMRGELTRALRQDWRAAYDRHLRRGDYRYHVDDVASRRLKNLALSYLMADPQDEDIALAVEQFNSANNMTDEFAALRALVHSGRDEGKAVLARFYDRWRHEDLVIDKWFTVQATAPHAGTIEVVRQLRRHPDFHLRNPNRARSLIGAFAQMNPIAFHDLSGQGYDILCDAVMEMERFNPAVAARLLQPLGRWQRHDPRRQGLMKERLEKILKVPDLAKDVYEIAAKSLNAS